MWLLKRKPKPPVRSQAKEVITHTANGEEVLGLEDGSCRICRLRPADRVRYFAHGGIQQILVQCCNDCYEAGDD